MKKFSLLVICFLIIMVSLSAQAYESAIQYNKKKQTAITIDYAYPAEAVENAFIQKMEKLGYRSKEETGLFNKDKGFLLFKNVHVTDISHEKMDYSIKVERKSRKESEEAVLYLILSKDGENAMHKMDAYDIGRAKSFLNNLHPHIEVAHLELKITAQEETVSKAEKKLKNLQDDKKDLEKKLADNIKSQDETIKDIETQKQTLETLRGKRKKE